MDPEILRPIAHRTVAQQETLTLIRPRDVLVRLRNDFSEAATSAATWDCDRVEANLVTAILNLALQKPAMDISASSWLNALTMSSDLGVKTPPCVGGGLAWVREGAAMRVDGQLWQQSESSRSPSPDLDYAGGLSAVLRRCRLTCE